MKKFLSDIFGAQCVGYRLVVEEPQLDWPQVELEVTLEEANTLLRGLEGKRVGKFYVDSINLGNRNFRVMGADLAPQYTIRLRPSPEPTKLYKTILDAFVEDEADRVAAETEPSMPEAARLLALARLTTLEPRAPDLAEGEDGTL